MGDIIQLIADGISSETSSKTSGLAKPFALWSTDLDCVSAQPPPLLTRRFCSGSCDWAPLPSPSLEHPVPTGCSMYSFPNQSAMVLLLSLTCPSTRSLFSRLGAHEGRRQVWGSMVRDAINNLPPSFPLPTPCCHTPSHLLLFLNNYFITATSFFSSIWRQAIHVQAEIWLSLFLYK